MLKQLLLSWIIGLCIICYYAQSDPKVRQYALNTFIEQFCYALDCKMQARLENFSLNRIDLVDMRVTPKEGDNWFWQVKTFSVAFSWTELLLYGSFDLSVQLKTLRLHSSVHDERLCIDDHLYRLFKGPQLNVYTFLRDIICEDAQINIQDSENQRFFDLQFDCKAKKMDNRLKAAIDLYDGSFSALNRMLFKQMSGSLQLDSFDGQPSGDICVKGAASIEIPQLGAEVTPCYISGSWHHNRGSFSLKNVDHSFAIDPIIITKNAGSLQASLEAKMPISYILHMATNANNDDRLQGSCTVQTKLFKTGDEFSCKGNVTVQRIHWLQTEIGSLAKMTFEKKQDTISGALYIQRTSGACFGGTWSCDMQGAAHAEIKNNARLTFSPKHDWQIFPEDFFVQAQRFTNGSYAIHYEGKATHVKAQHAIMSSGDVLFDGLSTIDASGMLDDHAYTCTASFDDQIYIHSFTCQNPSGQPVAHINGDRTGNYNGMIDIHCLKDILKKHLQFDLQGEGICTVNVQPENNRYRIDLHLHQGTIRLPRTYNFINGFDCSLALDVHHKKCIGTDFMCTLHNGTMRSKKIEIALSDDLSFRYIYAPLLIEQCSLNIEKELFAVVSGSLVLSKKQHTDACIKGILLIDRAQLKENLFSERFQKNMFNVTSYSFDRHDNDIQCDILIKTKHPIRVQAPFIETDARIDLHVSKAMHNPEVTGSIYISSGQLHFPYKPLYITRGALHFVPGKLDDPLIELEAKNTIKKNTINLHVSGSLHNHNVSLESSPALTEEQIISLLFVGSQEESLNIVMPALIMQNIKSILFGYDQSSQATSYFGTLFKPFKRIHLVPSFIDQSGRGGLRGAIEIELSERCRALIQKNFNLTEDTRFELEYMISDDMCVRATRDIRRDLIAEVEMRYKFGN